jgi:aerobic carbon-monoxide dehydrogenase medium subunit
MKSTEFDYAVPHSLEEAIKILQSYEGNAKIISGGQSLMPMLNYRLLSPDILVDLQAISGLNEIIVSQSGTKLGSRVRWVDIEKHSSLYLAQPLLCSAISHVAHYQIRNRGTVGGSLAHADPAAEMPGLAMVLDATIDVMGPEGIRTVQAKDFFLSQLSTSISPYEIIVSINLPFWPNDRKWGFSEFSRRKGDYAMAGAAVWYDLNSNGEAFNIHIGLIGVGEKPIRLSQAEDKLENKKLSQPLIEDVVIDCLAQISFQSDINANENYRRSLMSEMILNAFSQASFTVNK